MQSRFVAPLWQWRGPAPYFWLTVPPDVSDAIAAEAAETSYGWGAIPVRVRVGTSTWETSLLPKDGGYVLPVKKLIREAERIGEGDPVAVAMDVSPRGGRAANGTGRAV